MPHGGGGGGRGDVTGDGYKEGGLKRGCSGGGGAGEESEKEAIFEQCFSIL